MSREDDATWTRSGIGDRISDWVSRARAAFLPQSSSASRGLNGRSDTPATSRLALVVTLLWVAALGAYAVGYFVRLGESEGAIRSLPTLDLLFFAFAILGPVAMLWIVVSILNRAERLSEAITGQSESALVLAATIGNLNDSVDALASNTTGRLEQACDRMEREAAASVVALDKALKSSTEKLETALLDGVIMMDGNLRERSERAGTSLEKHQDEVAELLKSAVSSLRAAMKDEIARIGELREELSGAADAGTTEVRTKIEDALSEMAKAQSSGMDTANSTLKSSAEAAARELKASIATRIAEIDKRLETSNKEISDAASATSELVRKDVYEALNSLRSELAEVQQSVSVNPPASAEDLAALMGEAVHRIVSPERTALTQSVLRITALEDQARSLIDKIDRTSRLAPWMVESSSDGPVVTSEDKPSLPLGNLLPGSKRRELNWTSVVHVLAGLETIPGTESLVECTLQDADLTRVIGLRDQISDGLGADGLFADDILPEHAHASVWQRFARDEITDGIAPLAGVKDHVANAIARGWLRRDPDNRQLAFRFIEAYRRLLSRAVDDIGADPRLVELAETSAGRFFIFLGGLLGVFGARHETE
ncbi:MAG: hypothetical protein AAGD13_18770 [Pseudomonadota bacterium]